MSEIRFLVIYKFSEFSNIKIKPSVQSWNKPVGHTFYCTHWILSVNILLKYLDLNVFHPSFEQSQENSSLSQGTQPMAVTLIWQHTSLFTSFPLPIFGYLLSNAPKLKRKYKMPEDQISLQQPYLF